MEKMHVDVIIATPGNNLSSQYIKSLLSTISELAKEKISWAFVNEFSSHVADAREKTISGFGYANVTQQNPLNNSFTYNKIIWIDSDISWEVDDFMRLYRSNKDVISGSYLQADGYASAYKEVLGSAYTYDEIIKLNKLTKVAAVGFGFIGIKFGVFEKMTRPWFQSTEVSEIRDGVEYKYNILGEDLSWCYRASNIGYDIWLDPEVKVIHHKTMRLTWEGPMPV